MTRPMPGPPGGFTDRARLNYALLGKQITYEQYQEFGDALTRAFTARPKRLTDAECAAETWKAHCKLMIAEHAPFDMRMGLEPALPSARYVYEADIWHRFAAHPHALDAGGGAS